MHGLISDRDLDCQMAMADVSQSVAEYGEAAGWTEREVADALIELAHNRWFMLDSKNACLKRPSAWSSSRQNPLSPLPNEMMATIHPAPRSL